MAISNSESITVKDKKKDIFESSLKLVLNAIFLKDKKVTGYLEMNNTLYFTRFAKGTHTTNAIYFPFPLSQELTVQFAWEWLANNPNPIEQEPIGDGSSSVGWEITTEGLDKIGFHAYFCSIRPVWFYYGK